jgi:methyl-accepting chemotaxis protein
MTDTATGAGDLQERLDFIGMDEPTRSALGNLKPIIDKVIGPALDIFYEKVRKAPQTRRLFNDERHIAHAKGRQEQHWEVIATAEFGVDYARRVKAIGQTHARLGLEPRWYIGGYAVVAEQLVHAVIKEQWPNILSLSKGRAQGMAQAVSALLKAVMLDMDLAISTYLEALDEQRRQAEEARLFAEKNQAEALQALATALDRLAAGDLRTRMNEPLATEFDKVKADFNTTMTKLQQSMLNVSSNSRAISSGTQEISVAADNLLRRTEQQAASLEETAAALDEITMTVKKAAEGAAHARDVVANAKGDAEKGGAVVRKAVDAMGSIEKSSQQISQIIGVIDEIAFQTNLLALNAGVEAARAGDAGRGFAVVASEVRALAQRSAEAAKEIKGLISTSTVQVNQGVELVAETGKSLERIMAQVLEINKVVSDIAAGAQEQATGLQQVNIAVNQMDQVTQQNAAMVEQTTAASQSLSQETAELDRLIGNFQLGEQTATQPSRHQPVASQLAQRGALKAKSSVARPALQTAPGRQGSATVRRAEVVAAEDGWQDF